VRGSVRKRGETWTWYLWEPDPLSGKPRQRTKGGYRTKRACQDGLTEALARLREGTFVQPSPRVLRAFLVDEWLPAVRRHASGPRPGPATAWPSSGTSSPRSAAWSSKASRRLT
jgi:hypothetical protein